MNVTPVSIKFPLVFFLAKCPTVAHTGCNPDFFQICGVKSHRHLHTQFFLSVLCIGLFTTKCTHMFTYQILLQWSSAFTLLHKKNRNCSQLADENNGGKGNSLVIEENQIENYWWSRNISQQEKGWHCQTIQYPSFHRNCPEERNIPKPISKWQSVPSEKLRQLNLTEFTKC